MADISERTSIHVLLLPYPSQGHINPIFQFGKRLAAHRGVRCTLAATRFVISNSQPCPGDAIRIAAISDGCDRGGRAARTCLGWSRPGRRPWTSSSGPRRSRAGPWTCWCTTRSCRGRSAWRGVPCTAFFTQPCAVDVVYAHAWAGRVQPPLVGEEPVELPGLSLGLRPVDMPSFLADSSGCPAYLDLLVNQFDGLPTADHVLVNSFYELQPQVRRTFSRYHY